MFSANQVLFLTRAGYEGDCAAQVQAVAAEAGVHGYCKAKADTGYLTFIAHDAQALTEWFETLALDELIFARQLCLAGEPLADLPPDNRLGPILAALDGQVFGGVFVETPDADATRPLMRLARQFTKPLEQSMRKRGLLEPGNRELPRLHLTFTDSTTVIPGWSHPGQAAPRPMGIPRLKLSKHAPSRSALKLEEALITFLSPDERQELLRAGLEAVDLGAAPGGWTWQLVRDGLMVTAVDNGPMAEELAASHQVEHRREDGFTFRPERPVEWLVCDMVEKPIRVAALMADWMARGDCRRAIFNLKLPMKKRQQAVMECRELIEDRLVAAEVPFELDIRQLYHDRDEVTAYLRRVS
ncbi:23S rRNA (cytidine(2498)-2'-O)-methyltransferase RlmM [Guyparkeria sp. TX1]|uniref:23S rRNA (cytidine(2498)-2'-O)-methyltransferase RlmM n=1 Tax=Guyparkeria sp. TX1 TaxID=3115001 RepID=UPI0039776594